MDNNEYGVNFKEHLLEQYKLYVEMADNVSARRAQSNAFYTTLLSGLLAILSFVIDKSDFFSLRMVFFSVSVLGLIVCFVWYRNIQSYRQLNSGKFKIIHEMEKFLPFDCYSREWKLLGKGADIEKYFPLTHIEQYVPFLLAVPYIVLLVYSIFGMTK